MLYVAHGGARRFDEDDLAFLAVVAGRVGLLLERAELSRAQREIERQRAQAAARQELLGIVTHELKTPVAVLKAYAELLHGRAEAAGRAEDVDVLERMEDQAERLLAMVEQVLDLQRIDAGLFPLEVGRVTLRALAERVLDGLRLTASTVRLRLDADEDVVVRADRRRLEQVLTNLVQNAIRFSPPDGEVRVTIGRAARLPDGALDEGTDGGTDSRLSRDAGWAVVSVSDQGPGVAEQDRRRIFRRFYQGQGGDRLHRGHGGLGVGLYIAREIAERHGGALWLEPAHDAARGATFSFAVPEVGPETD